MTKQHIQITTKIWDNSHIREENRIELQELVNKWLLKCVISEFENSSFNIWNANIWNNTLEIYKSKLAIDDWLDEECQKEFDGLEDYIVEATWYSQWDFQRFHFVFDKDKSEQLSESIYIFDYYSQRFTETSWDVEIKLIETKEEDGKSRKSETVIDNFVHTTNNARLEEEDRDWIIECLETKYKELDKIFISE